MDTAGVETSARWLRVSCLVGAAVDGLLAVALVCPPLLQIALGVPAMGAAAETRTAWGMAAALMAGWTVLLVWASRRPTERKGVLLITVFPVIIGLALATLYGTAAGDIPLPSAAAVWVGQAALCTLFLVSYCRASGSEAGR